MDKLIPGIGVLVAYCAVITIAMVRVWQSDFYDANQKLAQTALLWLLPVAGLVMVRGVMASQGYPTRGGNAGFFAGVWLLVDPGSANSYSSSYGDAGSGGHSSCDSGGHHGGGSFDGGGGGGGGDGGGGYC